MENIDREKLLQAVYRKAVGYPTSETVEEYSLEDGKMVVTKQRITTKESPPDISAAKILLELCEGDDLTYLTDEELEKEKIRLLAELNKIIMEKEGRNEHDAGSGGKM